MMRKLIACICALILLAGLPAGCGRKEEPGRTSPEEAADPDRTESAVPETPPESVTEILDRDGKKLGAIDSRASATAADAGVFYSLWQPVENVWTGPAEYRFFRVSDGKDIRLGTLEDQGYEAVYTRTELDGKVYTLALAGNPFDDKADTLCLLAADPAAETLTKTEISKKGFPYAAMAAADGKLLILNHETGKEKCDKIYAFDPASGGAREVLSFPDDGSSSLRSVAAAEDGFYLLRLTLKNGAVDALVLDRYDSAYRKVSEQPLQESFTKAALSIRGLLSEGDVRNEAGMMVSGFAVEDGRYLFYENFGIARLVLDLQTGDALLAQDDQYSMAPGGGRPLLYRLDFEKSEAGPEILEVKDGALQAIAFTPSGSRTLLQRVSVSPNGSLLFQLSEHFPAQEKETVFVWRTEP